MTYNEAQRRSNIRYYRRKKGYKPINNSKNPSFNELWDIVQEVMNNGL